MAVFAANAEEGTEGATVTVGVWAVVTGNIIYTSPAARMGGLGYRFTFTGTPIVNLWSNTLTTATGSQAQRHRWNMKVSAYPSSGIAMVFQTAVSNGTEYASVRMDTAGHLLVYSNGVLKFTSTYVVPLNTYVRCELVIAGGGATTTTGILGFGAVTGNVAITATNSASNAYYYATNVFGSSAAFGNFKYGKNESTSVWTGTLDIDDVAGDNSTNAAKTWTSAPSTWLGPGASSLTSVLAAAATAGFTIGGRKDITGPTLVASASSTLAIAGSRFGTASSVLSVAALSSFTIAPSVSELAVLPMAAGGSLSIAGFKTLSAVLTAAANGTLTIGAVRTQFGTTLLANAGSAFTIGAPLRTQFGAISLGATSTFAIITNGGFSGALLLDALSSFTVTGRKDISAVLPVGAVGSLAIAGRKDLPYVLSMRGTPTLTIAALVSRQMVLAMRGTPVLVIGPLRTAIVVLSMNAVASLVNLGRVIGDIHPYDNVIAVVLSRGVLAVPFPSGNLASVLDSGRRSSVVLEGGGQAAIFPSGMIAVIQD